MKQKAKLVFSVSTYLLASHIIHPHSNLALVGRLTPAQLQLVIPIIIHSKFNLWDMVSDTWNKPKKRLRNLKGTKVMF